MAALVGSATVSDAYNVGASIAVLIPAGVNGGNLSFFVNTNDADAPVTLTGADGSWTVEVTSSGISGGNRTHFYRKNLSADSTATTLTLTASASVEYVWGAWAVDLPYSTHTVTAAGTWSSTAWVAPAITSPAVSSLRVNVFPSAILGRDLSPPVGETEFLDTGRQSWTAIAAGYKAVGSGSLGVSGNWVPDEGAQYMAYSIVYSGTASGSTFTITGSGSINFDQPSGPPTNVSLRNPFGFANPFLA